MGWSAQVKLHPHKHRTSQQKKTNSSACLNENENSNWRIRSSLYMQMVNYSSTEQFVEIHPRIKTSVIGILTDEDHYR